MSTVPPEQPDPAPVGYTLGSTGSIVRLPVPGNAELLIYILVEIMFAIIWAASDVVGARLFMWVTAIVTFAYLISRGIAKASRVLEH
jgi:hypothetical protein